MITLIAAVADNNVIGYQGKIPWNIPEDLRRFRFLTLGKPIVMGRKTFESLPKRPLPGRKNIVVTNNKEIMEQYKGGEPSFCTSVESALELAKEYNENFHIIGGEKIYRDTIDLADKLEITHVNGNFEGDAYFPTIDCRIWRKITRASHEGYSFVTYLRR